MEASPFFKLVNSPLKFRLYLLQKLPAAFFSGLRVVNLDPTSCTVSVPYKWLTKNPFRSTYFASLAMAAEMSTGLLALESLYKRKPAVSMLVTGMNARYFKKAVSITYFTCNDGSVISQTVGNAVKTGESISVTVKSLGMSVTKQAVAEFTFEWSFKVKKT